MTAAAQDTLHIRARSAAAAGHATRVLGGHVGRVIAERCRDVLLMPWLGTAPAWLALIDDVLARRTIAQELAAYAQSLEQLAEQAETPDERRPGLRQAAALLRMADQVEQVPGQRTRVELGRTA